ncbi:Calx-beta domain protein [Gemmata sp. SH-PL17]|uniref:Ig-like domain repeat protein n=1 Tax=Gemmata sp. SH-PL17 TaxID=1630693 RepID=UPI00078BA575|nr:Ig-like domain repeat protein [Gemmata sp. SH-PL17]AMV24068.1 Calx-beta domain protein [Gemmata sp. SH-PL17]
MTAIAGTGYALGTGTMADVQITNVPLTVSISPPSQTMSEGGGGTITVSRTGAGSQPVTVNLGFGTSNGRPLATWGTDFTLVAGNGATLSGPDANGTRTLLIPAGILSVPLSVTVNRDNLVENPNEGFRISVLTGSGYTLGSVAAADVEVVDVPPTITFGPPSLVLSEGGSGGTLTVYREGGDPTQPLTVTLAFGTDTWGDPLATPGADYTITASGGTLSAPDGNGRRTLLFPANTASVALSVTAPRDNMVDNTEGFRVSVYSGAVPGAGIPGSGSGGSGGSGGLGSGGSGGTSSGTAGTADVRITDAPPAVTFGPATQIISEGGSGGSFTVNRMGGDTAQPLTVMLAFGTDAWGDPLAAPGSDYTITAPGGVLGAPDANGRRTLLFGAGVTSVSLSVTAPKDNLVEGFEGFRASVDSGAVTGSSGGSATADVRITDVISLDLSAAPSPTVFGQSVTLTATFGPVAPGGAVPTGTVTFRDGTTVLGTGTVGPSGGATVSVSGLAIGTHAVTATYNGDATFAATTSAAVNHRVDRAATTTSVADVTTVYGQAVTLTATVAALSPGAGTPTGQVVFTIAGQVQPAVTLDGNGRATLTATSMTVQGGGTIPFYVGTLQVTARYAGDTNFVTSTSPAAALTVREAETTTAVAADLPLVAFGQAVTFTATVAPVAPGAGVPTGQLHFTIDGVAQPAVTLDGQGRARVTRSDLAVGTHRVFATYSGSPEYGFSVTQAPFDIEVVKESTATVVAASDPRLAGQEVTLTATVTRVHPGTGVPGGTVSFSSSGTYLGDGTLDADGVATLRTTALAAGARTVYAIYTGNSNYAHSTSQVLDLTVRSAASVSVSASADPSVFGQAVTFTATVTAGAGPGTPTGTVTFKDGETTLGTGTLDAQGRATLTTSSLSVGYHNVQVSYGGDSTFGPSEGARDLSVNPAETRTQLSWTWGAGGSVTLTATVTAVTPGSGTPTGNIKFSDGVTDLGSVPLDSQGRATTTVTLAEGPHNIVASFDGVTNFNPSASSNAPPTAPGASVQTNAGAAKTVTIAIADADNDAVDVVVKQPANGTAAYNGQGAFTYTPPNATWLGTATFTYLVRDGRGGMSVGTVTVKVTDPNSLAPDFGTSTHPKKAVAYAPQLPAGTTLTGNTQGAHGTVTFANGTLTYTPTALDWTGLDTFTYTVTNGTRTDAGKVTVEVTPWPELVVTPSADPAPFRAGQPVTFTATASGGTEQGYTYKWDFGDGSAVATGANQTHTYATAGVYTAWVTVTDSVGNSEAEAVEVAVTDTVTVTSSSSVAEGGDPGAFTFARTGTKGDLTVTYTVLVASTATAGDDYEELSGSVVIPDGATSVDVRLTARRDNLVEGSERVEVKVENGTGYEAGAPGTAFITIADDPPTITVTKTTDAREQDLSAGRFTFTRTGGDLDSALVVNYTVGGTAEQANDFVALLGSVTFRPGETTATVDVTPKRDNVVEAGGETVTVTVREASTGTKTYLTGAPGTASLTIADDPAIVSATGGAAKELGQEAATFEVTRTRGNPDEALTVAVALGGSATLNTDYTLALSDDPNGPWTDLAGAPASITIAAGKGTVYLRVTPKLDNAVENGGETVTLTITPDANKYQVGAGPAATVTIADDPPVVTVDAEFHRDAYEENPEQSYGFIILKRTGGDTSVPIDVSIGLSGQAESGVDYNALPATVALKDAAEIKIVPKRDNRKEGPETVTLTVTPNETKYKVGAPNETSISIEDDPPVVKIERVKDAAEPSAAGEFVITRSHGNLEEALTVYLHTDTSPQKSATPGTDYDALPASIEFAGTTELTDEQQLTVKVTPKDDTEEEGSETVTLAFSEGDYTVGGSSSAVVTIEDDDGSGIQFTDPGLGDGYNAAEVSEGAEFTLVGTYRPAAGTPSGTQFLMTINWGDGTQPTTHTYTLGSAGAMIGFSYAHRFADDGWVDDGFGGRAPGNGTASDPTRVQVSFTRVGDTSVTARRAFTTTVKNVRPSAVTGQVTVNPDGRGENDPRGVLVQLTLNVTDPGSGDFHKATITWGDGKTTQVDFSQPVRVYHTYEVGVAPGATPGNRVYNITFNVADDDQPTLTVSGAASVTVREQAPVLVIDHISPSNPKEGDEVTVVGSLMNPGQTTWGQVRVTWGVTGAESNVALVPWAQFNDAFGRPESQSYSTALRFEAKYTYRNNKDYDGETPPRPFPYALRATVKPSGGGTEVSVLGQPVVENVVPSKLRLQLAAPLTTAPAPGQPVTITLKGSFVDPGLDDEHTVSVDWGDGSPVTTFTLTRGSRAFDPSEIGTKLSHTFTALPQGGIKVTVSDDGPVGRNSVTSTLATKVLSPGQVLSGYYQESQKVKEQSTSESWVEIIVQYANRLYDLTVGAATQFIDSVGDFVSKLSQLERTLSSLFGETVPKVLDGLLADPTGFGNRLVEAGKRGFAAFFQEEHLLQTMQNVVLNWVKNKIPADVLIEAKDLPDITKAPEVAGFVLKVLGLTWDDFVARAAAKIGPDNIQLLSTAYDFISAQLQKDDQLGFLTGLPEMLANGLRELEDNTSVQALLGDVLTADNMKNLALDAIKNQALKIVATKAIQWAGSIINPAGGGLTALYNVATWLVTNINQVNDLALAVKELGDNVDQLKVNSDAAINAVANKITALLETKLAPLALDLGMSVLGLSTLPRDVFKAVASLRQRIGDKVDLVMDKVVSAVTRKFDKVLARPGLGRPDQFAGLIGNVVTFEIGGLTYRMWAVAGTNGGAPKFMFGSLNAPLDKYVADWTLEARTTPALRTLLNNEAKAQQAATPKLKLADTEYQKLKTEMKAQAPAADPKALAAQQAKIKKQLVVFGKATADLKAIEGGTKPGDAIGELAQTVLACLNGACFVAGTPLLTPNGAKSIEEITVGELVLSRSELDPSGPVVGKVVEAVLVRPARVLNLHIGGQVIGTTAEHPFFTSDRGWTPAGELQAGDRIATLSGEWIGIEETFDTGLDATVYNLRVADFHTYFVGGDHWGFAAWAHNTYEFLSGRKVATDVAAKMGTTIYSMAAKNKIVELILAEGAKGAEYGVVGDYNAITDAIAGNLIGSYGFENQVPTVERVIRSYFGQANIAQSRATLENAIPPGGWKEYIKNKLNDKDAIGRDLATYNTYISGLGLSTNTHGHHIINKLAAAKGTGKAEGRDARDILLYFGINPYWGQENLAYAPNHGHPKDAIVYMDSELNKAFIDNLGNFAAGKAATVTLLQQFAAAFILKQLPGQ